MAKAKNNGVHVKGSRDRRWQWQVLDCTKGTGTVEFELRYQRDAIRYGRVLARRLQCELVVHGRNGKIRRKDSFGRDPRNTKG